MVPLDEPRGLGRALAELLDVSAEGREAMSTRSRRITERDCSVSKLVRKRVVLWRASVRPTAAREVIV
jgi:hypothetical protein